jgi:hypothetical protein
MRTLFLCHAWVELRLSLILYIYIYIKFLPGTDVMIFKIFSPKNFGEKFAFLTQNKAKLCKNLIITLVFEKNANFFTENCQKSQKIVIITSTPGCQCTNARLLEKALSSHSFRNWRQQLAKFWGVSIRVTRNVCRKSPKSKSYSYFVKS